MSFIKVIKADELQPGEKLKVEVQGKSILLANLDGSYFALDDRCPHLGGSLSRGEMRGSQVFCPKHGAAFDLKTGKNEGDAKIAFIKMKVNDARTYPVKVEDGDVLVDID